MRACGLCSGSRARRSLAFQGFFIIFFIYSWPGLLHFVRVLSIYIMMVNGVLHWGWGAIYLLGGFGGALLVVSILRVVCDCRWWPLFRSWGVCCYWVLWELCPFWPRAWSECTSSSEVYPTAKRQWHFTCGFDFRRSLWLPLVAAFAVLKGLKMKENIFHFMLNACFVLEIYMFLSWVFGYVEKRLHKKVMVNSNIYDITNWATNTHITQ